MEEKSEKNTVRFVVSCGSQRTCFERLRHTYCRPNGSTD
jgi:hypothetical protein